MKLQERNNHIDLVETQLSERQRKQLAILDHIEDAFGDEMFRNLLEGIKLDLVVLTKYEDRFRLTEKYQLLCQLQKIYAS